MREQTIIWTALPNGRNGGQLRLSVLVSPRLATDAAVNEATRQPKLSQFPDFLDWPARARNATFGVSFDGGGAVPAQKAPGSATPDSALWKALFGNAFVRPHAFDAKDDAVVTSYPAKHVRQFLKERYAAIAAEDPREFPFGGSIEDSEWSDISPGAIHDYLNPPDPPDDPPPVPIVKAGPGTKAAPKAGTTFAATPEPTADFAHLKVFHERPKLPKSVVETPPVAPVLDFHQVLAGLGSYPFLLRRLGLVFDLVVAAPALPGEPLVHIVPTWTSTFTADGDSQTVTHNASPRTRSVLTAVGFSAKPRDGARFADGMLRLEDDRFTVLDVDVDALGLKAIDFVGNVQMSSNHSSVDTPETFGIPSGRSVGLSITELNRSSELAKQLTQAKSNNDALEASKNGGGGAPPELFLEDLIRGYRLDVLTTTDTAPGWKTVVARQGRYAIEPPTADKPGKPDKKKPPPGPLFEGIVDEGWVSLAVAKTADPDPAATDADALYLHESLVNWFGWSLVAPRPGMTIDKTPNHDPNNTHFSDSERSEPGADFPMAVSFQPAKGSLPRLRVGETYRLRARLADLAGNGVPLSSTDVTHATDEVKYTRPDPVPQPVVLMHDQMTEAEALERPVIRSNYNTEADKTKSVQRHVAPPKIAQLQAEELGMFDTAKGKPDPDQYKLIVDREAGVWSNAKHGKPDERNHGQPYFKHHDVDVPYLPDPFARGVAFLGLPGLPADSPPFKIPFDPDKNKAWPDIRSLRLEVVEGSGAPIVVDPDKKQRALLVQLPKAWVVPVRYSSYLGSDGTTDDIDRMLIYKWLQEEEPTAAPDFRTAAQDGQAWMVTPYRTLLLVHAVRQPLIKPEFNDLQPVREFKQTFTLLDDLMDVDRRSTQRLDIGAMWTETLDVLAEPGPRVLSVKAEPMQLRVNISDELLATQEQQFSLRESETMEQPEFPRHEFGDTKYRRITYHAIATSRFPEYFTEQKDKVKLDKNNPKPVDDRGIVPFSEVVKLDEPGGVTFQRHTEHVPGDYVVDYDAGIITLVPGSAIPDGAKVSVRYVPQSIIRDSREEPNPSQPTIDVPSSARPAAPGVEYIVPTFAWSGESSATGVTSERKGMGLRVYLRRPWFSSGDGEQLGVVLWPGPAIPLPGLPPEPPESLQALTTRWGRDPVWRTNPTDAFPTTGDFPLAVDPPAETFTLAERPDSPPLVEVAPHDVQYDETRKLWFCDIEVQPGNSYTPFIRLALARFQRHSVATFDGGGAKTADVHLSPVVLADFAQVAPNRSVTITYSPTNPQTLQVEVNGLSWTEGPDGPGAAAGASGPLPIAVTVERRSGLPGELGWEAVAGSEAELTPAAVPLAPQGTTTWSGTVTLPAARGTEPFRLSLEEFEQMHQRKPDGTFAPATRVVFADQLEI